MLNETELYLLCDELKKQLIKLNLRLTCAESCTGGLVAKAITDVAGCSAYFDRGFITYSNQAKQDLLGVKQSTLVEFGAVSQQTVSEMANGALNAAQTEIAIAITGIAGPDGGTPTKPVGTVWFAWAYKGQETRTEVEYFVGDRHSVRMEATIFVIKQLVEHLSKNSLDTV